MSKNITINPVDIEVYMKAVEDYNKLPEKDRTSWLDLRKGYKKPFDGPVLYQSYYEDIDSDLITYTLQIVPEWASSSDSIDSIGTFDAEDFYDDLPNDLYKQNLKLIVFYYDAWATYAETLTYEEFLSHMAEENAIGSFKKSAFNDSASVSEPLQRV